MTVKALTVPTFPYPFFRQVCGCLLNKPLLTDEVALTTKVLVALNLFKLISTNSLDRLMGSYNINIPWQVALVIKVLVVLTFPNCTHSLVGGRGANLPRLIIKYFFDRFSNSIVTGQSQWSSWLDICSRMAKVAIVVRPTVTQQFESHLSNKHVDF